MHNLMDYSFNPPMMVDQGTLKEMMEAQVVFSQDGGNYKVHAPGEIHPIEIQGTLVFDE